MRILLQGTGAADGIPAFFADSRVSQHARQHGGKDVRTRAAALVDGHLKLDFGPDTYMQSVRDGLNPRDWSAILFTHTHDDHFCLSELQYMLYSFTDELYAPIAIYGNASIIDRLDERFPDWPFEFIRTHSFEPFLSGEYKITPVAAFHKIDEDCHNLLIEHNGKRFLYATDTGYWREPTWEFLSSTKLDALVIECTDGVVKSGYHGHLDLDRAVETVKRLREMGALSAGVPVVTTHHCHLGEATHGELEQLLAPHQIQPGFDGMILDI